MSRFSTNLLIFCLVNKALTLIEITEGVLFIGLRVYLIARYTLELESF
jgi:hypothetical protein